METRRIRRLERRRTYRIVGLAVAVGIACVALGMSLPHNRTASILLFVAAFGCVVVLLLADDAHAPLHGVRRVVRLPLLHSVSVTLESFRSRLVGSFRATVLRRMEPTPIVLDEPDDEAAAWWGTTALATPVTAGVEPEPEPAPEPELPPVIVAAPLAAAHVATHAGLRTRVKQWWIAARQRVARVVSRIAVDGGPPPGAGASAGS